MGIDSETELIQNGYETPPVVIAGFASGGVCQLVMWQDLPEYLPLFLSKNPTTKLVFFNIHFDINAMGRDILLEELKKENRCQELSIAYKIYAVGSSRGWFPPSVTLEYVARKTLGIKLNKEDGTRTSFRRDEPVTDRHMLYLAEDCIATELCGQKYNNLPTETIQARASFVLSEISKNGLKADIEHIKKHREAELLKMAELAKKLRMFGFKVKKETDDLTQIQRISRVAAMFGHNDLESRLTAMDKKSFPGPALWLLTANVLNAISANDTPLPSDISDAMHPIIQAALVDDMDWTAKNKPIKEMADKARQYIRDYLSKLGCEDAVADKSPKAEVALTILETLCEKYKAGELADGMEAFDVEFRQCYDENLGWLKGTKPITNAQFIQKHLRKLIASNPGLTFPLTKASEKAVKKYVAKCRREGVNPDDDDIMNLSVFACKRQEMWRLKDVGTTDAFLDVYTSYKHAEKLVSTYFTTDYIDTDGRVHSRFGNYLITGRTSSSSPNVQNLPREEGLREMYLAEKDHVLVSVDYMTMAN